MRFDGRDNTNKLRSFISIVVPSKNQNEDKNSLNDCYDFEKSLFYYKIIRNNNNNKNDYNDKSK